MPSNIFDTLLTEKVETYKYLFSDISEELFFDEKGSAINNPEYGKYRETICKDFIRFFIPRRLEIDQGFVIDSNNDVSHQCDIIIYDSRYTPLIESGERQRFFPVESVVAVGEVKSTVSGDGLKTALRRLSKIKLMREKVSDPHVVRQMAEMPFNPKNNYLHQIFTFLISKRIDQSLANPATIFDTIYGNDIEYRHRHNLILSIDNGLFVYHDSKKMDLLYPYHNDTNNKNRIYPKNEDSLSHIKTFLYYLYLFTKNASLFSPDMLKYMTYSPAEDSVDES
jgi:hypothetical protein